VRRAGAAAEGLAGVPGRTTIEPVAQRLIASGLYTQEEQSRGRWRARGAVHRDRTAAGVLAVGPAGRLVAGLDEQNIADVLLAGFVTAPACSMSWSKQARRETVCNGPRPRSARCQRTAPSLRYLVDGVQTLVGDAVLSGRT